MKNRIDMNVKAPILFSVLTTVFVFYFCPSAESQNSLEQATREINRPVAENLQQKLQPEPIESSAVETKEEKQPAVDLKFFIKEIILSGTESFPAAEFDTIKAKYENREVSMKELETFTDEIESEYLKRGILATCFIPPQKMEDDILKIQVVEAKMGDLHINRHKYFHAKRIEYYWRIPPGRVIRYPELLSSIFFINKNPDRKAKVILHKGKLPTTTDVTLDIKTTLPLHATYNFDTEGVTATGKERFTFGGRHNNFLGKDDTLLGGYLFGKDFSGIYTYHSLPLTHFGTSLVYGHSYSKAFPKKEFESLGVDSRARNISVALHQDILKNGNYRGEIHMGFDAKDKTTIQNSGTTNRDRLRIIRVGSNFFYRDMKRLNYLVTEISQGVNGFGARRRNSLSSREAKNVFTKFNFTVQHKENLPSNFQGSIQLKGQIASNRLTPQEGFFLGGLNSVRGYPSGDFVADDAIQTNVEILVPAFFIPGKITMPFSVKPSNKPLRDNITLLGFFDYGWGNKRNHLSNEKDTASLIGVGSGVRIRLSEKILLRLEWGFPVGDKTITESGNSRFHFSVDVEI